MPPRRLPMYVVKVKCFRFLSFMTSTFPFVAASLTHLTHPPPSILNLFFSHSQESLWCTVLIFAFYME